MKASTEQKITVGYKYTEIGIIPSDWNLFTMKQLGAIIDGDRGINYPGTDDLKEFGYCLFLNAKNVTKTGFKFKECQFITIEKDKKLNKGKLIRNDIVLTTRGTVGNIAFFNKLIPFENIRINSGMVIIRIDDTKVIQEYFYKLCQSELFNKQIDRLTFGSAQPQLTVKGIYTFQFFVPADKKEQRVIASNLSDIGDLIVELEKLINKKKNIKQGTMQELLTGKRRLPGFSEKWTLINMAEKSKLKARIGWQGLTTAEYLETGDYYLVTGTDFLGGRVNWKSCCYVDRVRYIQDRNIQLKIGDILLTKDGTIGKVGFVDKLPGPATLNSGVFVIRPKENTYNPLFLYYILTSNIFDDFLVKLQAGSTISHLYQKDFVNFSFLAPKLEGQNAIAKVLSDMDSEIEKLESQLYKYKEIKQGMMQNLLTGKIRLIKK